MWEGNTHDEVINGIVHVLKSNKIAIDQTELCAWANEQWCEADPDRCRTARSKDARLSSQRQAGLVSEPMQWATPFWRLWNVAVSSKSRPDDEARAVVEIFIEQASFLLNGDFGCDKCARHFSELLAGYPPGKINTWRQARIWLWHVHNESRDSKRVVPYYDIAKINEWEALSDEQVLWVIQNELKA